MAEPDKSRFQSSTVSFADVAHQTLLFDKQDAGDSLVLRLLDTRWVQRLRSISQTGNTKLVYMYSEHSRFGHSLGVAYLASLLMKKLRAQYPDLVQPYEETVAAAAILHDTGHVAPGSHLAERMWAPAFAKLHETVTRRVVEEDPEIQAILGGREPQLASGVCRLLAEDERMPPWTRAVISGGGWNADRGNWSVVDSAMCAVSYGRYNVTALIDAFCLSPEGELLLQENRLDALTHFFVARDSMYRQVYQHRVLQAADALTQSIVLRVKDILGEKGADAGSAAAMLGEAGIYCDEVMAQVLCSPQYAELPLATIFQMTETWWSYHVAMWCQAKDKILADLATRLRDRRLFKTMRLEGPKGSDQDERNQHLLQQAQTEASTLGYPPRYYVWTIKEKDKHRQKTEQLPMVALESGGTLPVTAIEPLIDQIMKRPPLTRRWLAVPAEVKAHLGRTR